MKSAPELKASNVFYLGLGFDLPKVLSPFVGSLLTLLLLFKMFLSEISLICSAGSPKSLVFAKI